MSYPTQLQKYLALPEEVKKTRLLIGDPVATAYAWIEAYAKQLSGTDDTENYEVTAMELIDTALTHLDEDSKWGGGYISKGGLLEGISTDPLFWEKLEILIDSEIPSNVRGNFFSCSC